MLNVAHCFTVSSSRSRSSNSSIHLRSQHFAVLSIQWTNKQISRRIWRRGKVTPVTGQRRRREVITTTESSYVVCWNLTNLAICTFLFTLVKQFFLWTPLTYKDKATHSSLVALFCFVFFFLSLSLSLTLFVACTFSPLTMRQGNLHSTEVVWTKC